MSSQLQGIIAIVFGIFFILVNRPASRSAVKWNSRLGFKVSEHHYRFPFIITGACFIVFGLLVVLGFISLKA
jgi:hypothetical protein